MAVPDYQSCMLPFLRVLSDGREHPLREAEDSLAETFRLTAEERAELLPSGLQGIFKNRVGWARTYLKKAGLLESPRRGVFRITELGSQTLAEQPAAIDVKYLERFPGFIEFRERSRSPAEPSTPPDVAEAQTTPEETMELAHRGLRAQLTEEVLSRVLSCSPAFFERMVVELLVKMGYGGSRRDAGESIGRSGDGGIDGIIKEDRLGLDTICIQAKRWQGSVGRQEIQRFVGALQGRRAKKGVFMTTSSYTREAIEYAAQIDTKVVLIDGQQLAELMIDADLGVAIAASYVVKRVDSDFFEEN